MREAILAYYAWLSGLANWLTTPISSVADALNLPLASAFLFGVIGATSPCQLSTNVAALGYLSRGLAQNRRVWPQTAAFVLGKVTVYSLVGGLLVVLGLQLQQVSQTAIPVIVVARRALGPLLLVVALVMLGVIRPRISPGGRLAAWLEKKVGRRRGIVPAYLLGVAFSFAFCPTLFWLFFGLTIPLALSAPDGLLFPGAFGIGVAMPVILLSGLLACRSQDARRLVGRLRLADTWLQRVVGLLFGIIGLHEIVLYWLL